MAEKQLTDYSRLLKKYVAAEKNLTNNPEKCGGVDYIKGYMSERIVRGYGSRQSCSSISLCGRTK